MLWLVNLPKIENIFLCKVLTNALGGCTMQACKGNGVFGLSPIDAIAFFVISHILSEKERSLWKLFLIILAVWYSTSVL